MTVQQSPQLSSNSRAEPMALLPFFNPSVRPEFQALDLAARGENVLLVGGPSGHRLIGEVLRHRGEHLGQQAIFLSGPQTALLEDKQGLKAAILDADLLVIGDFVSFLSTVPAQLFALLACRLEAGRSNVLLSSIGAWKRMEKLEYQPSAAVARLEAAGTIPRGQFVDRSWRYAMPMQTVMERLGIGIFTNKTGLGENQALADRITIPDNDEARAIASTLTFLPMSWADNDDVAACRCVIEPTPRWHVLCSPAESGA